MCRDAVLVRQLTVFLRCRGMLERLIVPPVVVMVRCHAMVVTGGLMVRGCMVMMFARSMLGLGLDFLKEKRPDCRGRANRVPAIHFRARLCGKDSNRLWSALHKNCQCVRLVRAVSARDGRSGQ